MNDLETSGKAGFEAYRAYVFERCRSPVLQQEPPELELELELLLHGVFRFSTPGWGWPIGDQCRLAEEVRAMELSVHSGLRFAFEASYYRALMRAERVEAARDLAKAYLEEVEQLEPDHVDSAGNPLNHRIRTVQDWLD